MNDFHQLNSTEFSKQKINAVGIIDEELPNCLTSIALALTDIKKNKATLVEVSRIECDNEQVYQAVSHGFVMRSE